MKGPGPWLQLTTSEGGALGIIASRGAGGVQTEAPTLSSARPCAPAGGRGVLPDPGHQAGAPAAAAAGGAAGGRENANAGLAGQVHQRDPGAHGRAAGVRVHRRQLHHVAHEDPRVSSTALLAVSSCSGSSRDSLTYLLEQWRCPAEAPCSPQFPLLSPCCSGTLGS